MNANFNPHQTIIALDSRHRSVDLSRVIHHRFTLSSAAGCLWHRVTLHFQLHIKSGETKFNQLERIIANAFLVGDQPPAELQ